jgi:hypothetical protein
MADAIFHQSAPEASRIDRESVTLRWRWQQKPCFLWRWAVQRA